MTSIDPPRLRTLRGLPAGLTAALQSSETDDPMPGSEELRDLERSVLGAAAGVAAIAAAASGGHGGKLALLGKLITAKLGIWVIPAMVGAGLGVCALGAGHIFAAATSHESAPSSPATIDGPNAPRLPSQGTNRPVESLAPPAAPVAPASSASTGAPAPVTRDPVGAQSALRPPPVDVAQANNVPGPMDLGELSEVDLIERAHRSMASDPVRAEIWLKEHERRFSDGTFVQEREAIAIEVLVRRGDTAGARARAARFFARFPHSAYAEHIEAMVRPNGIHKD